MPGIAGIIGRGDRDARAQNAQRMARAMHREPFYQTGCSHFDAAGVSIGWTAHPEMALAGGPVWNASKDVCLVLTGEAFSRQDLDMTGRTQAQQVVASYDKLGMEFLEQLDGSFAGVVVDLSNSTAFLFNDRYGLARIYTHWSGDQLYFSSEAKSILCAAPATRGLDQRSLAEYSSCGCVMQDRTLFNDVHLLPAGSIWRFVNGAVEEQRKYFNVAQWADQPRLPHEQYYAALSTAFDQTLPTYFRPDGAIAMSLTGGLDGRMIMAASHHAPGSLPCYTFGGPYRDCADVSIARAVAVACSQEHRVLPVGSAFLRQFETLAPECIYISDGAMDVIGSAELYANRLARQTAPIRMTGNYGSEILRSNVAFKAQPLNPLLYADEFLSLGEQAQQTFLQEMSGRRLTAIVAKQMPWHHPSRLCVEQSQVLMRSPYVDNEIVRLAFQAPIDEETSTTLALRFVSEHSKALGRIATDRGLLFHRNPAVTKVLNLMQELTFKAEYAYDYGMPQWMARVDHVARALRLERLFLGRHKFYHFRVWYRDVLGPYLREVLLDPRAQSRAHVRPGSLSQIVEQHIAGTHNHTRAIHQALSIELIYKQLVERAWT
jgi:asparagine synthase (glutamine-hydrolysing)